MDELRKNRYAHIEVDLYWLKESDEPHGETSSERRVLLNGKEVYCDRGKILWHTPLDSLETWLLGFAGDLPHHPDSREYRRSDCCNFLRCLKPFWRKLFCKDVDFKP